MSTKYLLNFLLRFQSVKKEYFIKSYFKITYFQRNIFLGSFFA